MRWSAILMVSAWSVTAAAEPQRGMEMSQRLGRAVKDIAAELRRLKTNEGAPLTMRQPGKPYLLVFGTSVRSRTRGGTSAGPTEGQMVTMAGMSVPSGIGASLQVLGASAHATSSHTEARVKKDDPIVRNRAHMLLMRDSTLGEKIRARFPGTTAESVSESFQTYLKARGTSSATTQHR